MVSDRASLLTPRERDCLLLVGQGRSSKEIAQLLDLSPYTVDEYIRTAVSKFGSPNRREAARALAAETTRPFQPPEKIGDEPRMLVHGPDSAEVGARAGHRDHPLQWFPLLRFGRRYNDLSALQRLVWIALGAVAIVVLMAQLSQGMHVIQSMFKGR
ncbi:MAG: helix-turn-helix transcriptional regulator [Sphingomonas sp.]